MILITTSRRPAKRTRTFIRDLSRVIPRSVRTNRGKKSVKDLCDLALGFGFNRILVVGSKRGNPSDLNFYSAELSGFDYIGTLKVKNVTLRREMTTRRAPTMNDITIIRLDAKEESDQVAKILEEGLNIEVKKDEEDINEAYKTYDCGVLIKTSESGVKITFQYLPTNVELGPRITVKEVVK